MKKNYFFKKKSLLFFCLLLTGSFLNAQTLLDEGFNGTALPAGWVIQSTAANDETWVFYDDYDDVEVNESQTTAQNEWLITPSLNLVPFSNIYLTFSPWLYGKNNAIIADTFDLKVKISTDNGLTWTELWNDDQLSVTDFQTITLYDRTISLPLAAYCGAGMSNVKVGFHYTSTGTATVYSGAYLMDVKVSTDCPKTSLSTFNTTTLNWFPISGYTGTYEIEYGPLGFTQGTGTMVTGLTGNSYTFPNSQCTYKSYIRTNCGGQQSAWATINFNNLVEVISNTPTSNSNAITWSGNTANYDIEYGPAGFVSGTGTMISNIPGYTYTINGLNSNTTYRYFIRANCGGVYGNWTSKNFATTTLFVNENQIENSFTIFPNPTDNILNIETKQARIEKIELFDIQGRLIISEIVKTDKHQLDVSHLQKATYLLKLFTEKGIQNTKIIKN